VIETVINSKLPDVLVNPRKFLVSESNLLPFYIYNSFDDPTHANEDMFFYDVEKLSQIQPVEPKIQLEDNFSRFSYKGLKELVRKMTHINEAKNWLNSKLDFKRT